MGGARMAPSPRCLQIAGAKLTAGSDGTDTRWRSALGTKSRSVDLAQSALARRGSTATKSGHKPLLGAAGVDWLHLRSSHPHGLNDLEDGGADDNKDKEGDKFWTDGVLVCVLASPFHLTPFGHIFGVLFVRLPHLGSRRHL